MDALQQYLSLKIRPWFTGMFNGKKRRRQLELRHVIHLITQSGSWDFGIALTAEILWSATPAETSVKSNKNAWTWFQVNKFITAKYNIYVQPKRLAKQFLNVWNQSWDSFFRPMHEYNTKCIISTGSLLPSHHKAYSDTYSGHNTANGIELSNP